MGTLKKTVFSKKAAKVRDALASPTAVKSAEYVSRIEAMKKSESMKRVGDAQWGAGGGVGGEVLVPFGCAVACTVSGWMGVRLFVHASVYRRSLYCVRPPGVWGLRHGRRPEAATPG